ncbi:MAG: hypothetical protein LQ342_006511 [Letrouitia transgressa]|nr:MAG: hypothetical protein LQ342_006511 [Letrouitia transgressa]
MDLTDLNNTPELPLRSALIDGDMDLESLKNTPEVPVPVSITDLFKLLEFVITALPEDYVVVCTIDRADLIMQNDATQEMMQKLKDLAGRNKGPHFKLMVTCSRESKVIVNALQPHFTLNLKEGLKKGMDFWNAEWKFGEWAGKLRRGVGPLSLDLYSLTRK